MNLTLKVLAVNGEWILLSFYISKGNEEMTNQDLQTDRQIERQINGQKVEEAQTMCLLPLGDIKTQEWLDLITKVVKFPPPPKHVQPRAHNSDSLN